MTSPTFARVHAVVAVQPIRIRLAAIAVASTPVWYWNPLVRSCVSHVADLTVLVMAGILTVRPFAPLKLVAPAQSLNES